MAYLDDTGLAYFWGKIKAWANSAFALLGHTHPSSDVTLMTGYSKPASSSAISASDSLNQAIGKLEKGAEAADGNAVHKTGVETVGGQKTFTGPYDRPGSSTAPLMSGMIIRNLEAERGVVPASNRYWTIACCDASGNEWDESSSHSNHGRIGAFEFYQGNGATGVDQVRGAVAVYKNVANDGSKADLSIGYDENGVAYASAPPTSASRALGNDIVTRSWLSNSASNLVHRTGDESIAGTKTFTDEAVVMNDIGDGTQIRLKRPTHSLIIRTDSEPDTPGGSGATGSSYLLVTDEGDPDGQWNSFRPVRIRHSDGAVFLGSRRAVTFNAGTLHVYLSQSGDDANDGLSSSAPVKTISAMQHVVSRFNTFRYVFLHVGPGSWGDFFIQMPGARCVYVSNYTANAITTLAQYDALTGDSEPPHFSSVAAYNVDVRFQNVKVDVVRAFNCDVRIIQPISFGTIYGSCSAIRIESTYYVHDRGETEGVFILLSSALRHYTHVGSFKSNITQSVFLQADVGSFISINSDASWTGTFAGQKMYTNSMPQFSAGGKNVTGLPGTGYSGSHFSGPASLLLKSGHPHLTLCNSDAARDGTVSAHKYWSIHFSDSTAGDAGTQYNSIGLIQAQKLSSGEHRICFQAYKPGATTDDYAIAAICYNAAGRKFFRVPNYISFLNDNNGRIVGNGSNATDIWISPCDSTEMGASLWLYGNAHTSYSGMFRIRACQTSSYNDLVGYPRGFLSWTGREYGGYNANNSYARFLGGTAWNQGAALLVSGKDMATYGGRFDLSATNSSGTTATLIGTGAGSLTWKGQTIQTTSDERKKDFISAIPDDVLDAWGSVEWSRFKYKADIAAKGEAKCRWHSGLVAQRVEKACADAGADILAYGMLCHDQSPMDVETGELDDLWTMRYEEALCMEAAYQRRRADRAEARIAALEDRLAALELRLGSE